MPRVVAMDLIDHVRLEKICEACAGRQHANHEQFVLNDAKPLVEPPSVEQLPLHD